MANDGSGCIGCLFILLVIFTVNCWVQFHDDMEFYNQQSAALCVDGRSMDEDIDVAVVSVEKETSNKGKVTLHCHIPASVYPCEDVSSEIEDWNGECRHIARSPVFSQRDRAVRTVYGLNIVCDAVDWTANACNDKDWQCVKGKCNAYQKADEQCQNVVRLHPYPCFFIEGNAAAGVRDEVTGFPALWITLAMLATSCVCATSIGCLCVFLKDDANVTNTLLWTFGVAACSLLLCFALAGFIGGSKVFLIIFACMFSISFLVFSILGCFCFVKEFGWSARAKAAVAESVGPAQLSNIVIGESWKPVQLTNMAAAESVKPTQLTNIAAAESLKPTPLTDIYRSSTGATSSQEASCNGLQEQGSTLSQGSSCKGSAKRGLFGPVGCGLVHFDCPQSQNQEKRGLFGPVGLGMINFDCSQSANYSAATEKDGMNEQSTQPRKAHQQFGKDVSGSSIGVTDNVLKKQLSALSVIQKGQSALSVIQKGQSNRELAKTKSREEIHYLVKVTPSITLGERIGHAVLSEAEDAQKRAAIIKTKISQRLGKALVSSSAGSIEDGKDFHSPIESTNKDKPMDD